MNALARRRAGRLHPQPACIRGATASTRQAQRAKHVQLRCGRGGTLSVHASACADLMGMRTGSVAPLALLCKAGALLPKHTHPLLLRPGQTVRRQPRANTAPASSMRCISALSDHCVALGIQPLRQPQAHWQAQTRAQLHLTPCCASDRDAWAHWQHIIENVTSMVTLMEW